MAYNKTQWQNNSAPYINADNLNNMEQGIYDNSLHGEYSTDEVVIGKWIDGKPIYRRVIELDTNIDLTSNHWVSLDISNYNVETILDIRGNVNITSDIAYGFQLIPRNVTDNNSGFGIGIGDLSRSQLKIQFGSRYTQVNYGEVIFEYTKRNINE